MQKPQDQKKFREQNRDVQQPGVAADHKTLIAPCRDLHPMDPFHWLRKGWADYLAAPRISLLFGLGVFLLSLMISVMAWQLGGFVLLLTLLTGFVFIAPLLAFALYDIPRQLATGLRPSLRHSIGAARRPVQNAMVFGLVLLVIFLIWARAGSMVHIFFPVEDHPGWRGILAFLMIGSAVGSLFAAFSFSASAFSLPMLANRDVDVVTAVISSINAVLRNKFTAAIWALLIVSLTAIGILTGLLGLVVVIPLLAYATWHAYRDALDASYWPTLYEDEKSSDGP